ncbi:MAG: response regulator [Myxococcaceae bacterium]|nr:response regulator [Myxococcaceae bacterium]
MHPITETKEPATDVLVIEDDPDIRELLCELLEEAGCRARCAVNGQQALELMGRHAPPNLILLDLMMPVMDGATFLEHLRQEPAWLAVPVIVLSASLHLQVPHPVDAVLRKPVDLDELLDTVSRLCRTPAGRQVAALV